MPVYKRGAVWRAEIKTNRIGEKPFRIARTFDTKTEAKTFEKAQRDALAEARRVGRAMPDTISVGEALEKWWLETEKAQAPSYRTTNQYRKDAWKKVYFAKLPVRELTVQHLEGWVSDERDREKSESTIRNCLYVLRALYKHAKKNWKWAISDPTIEVLGDVCVFQTKLNAESTANWTASPEQTEHLVHGKLDGQSKANWTPLS